MTHDFTKYFGEYGPIELDMGCGEPVSWGYPIVRPVGADLWDKLKEQHKVYKGDPGYFGGQYFVIIKTLTRAEAIEKYGEITEESCGPRGGFKSAKFGDKTFYSKYLKR